MESRKLEFVDPDPVFDDTGGVRSHTRSIADEKRLDRRCPMPFQAAVSMPPLATRFAELRDISRGGLFLTFKDPVTTLFELENAEIDVGACAEVAFSAPLDGRHHRVNLRGLITRVGRKGISLQFVTHNPPQLGALRDYLPAVETRHVPQAVRRHTAPPGRRRQLVKQAPESSCWQDWQLVD